MTLPNLDLDILVRILRSYVEPRAVSNKKETFEIMLHLTVCRNEKTGRAEFSLEYPAGKNGGNEINHEGPEVQAWLERLSRQ